MRSVHDCFIRAAAALLLLLATAPPAGAGEVPKPAGEAAVDTETFPGRFFIEHSQGFLFLSGGYADRTKFYAAIWDEGSSYSLGFGYEPCPAFRIGTFAFYSGHDDSGLGVDRLDMGHVRLGAALAAPLALDAGRWFESSSRVRHEGFVPALWAEIGLQVVDTTWDAMGRIFDRTITFSLGARIEIEYRTGSLGFLISAGVSYCGPLRPSGSYGFDPDGMVSFPLNAGIRIYI